jgi:hypothetical protein
MRWLLRIKEYYRDKDLADKCGLDIKDICKHEPSDKKWEIGDKITTMSGEDHTLVEHYCIKCGEFYK